MKRPRKRREPTIAEQKDGVYASEFAGREIDQVVETKEGFDGIPETHVNYKVSKKTGYRKTYKERMNYTTGSACLKECMNRIGNGIQCSNKKCRNFDQFKDGAGW